MSHLIGIKAYYIYVVIDRILRIWILTARQRSCEKVMFSVMSVCHSVCPQEGSCTGLCSRTCSNLFNLELTEQPPPPTKIRKHVLSESERLVFGWNAFLLLLSTRYENLNGKLKRINRCRSVYFSVCCQLFCSDPSCSETQLQISD